MCVRVFVRARVLACQRVDGSMHVRACERVSAFVWCMRTCVCAYIHA